MIDFATLELVGKVAASAGVAGGTAAAIWHKAIKPAYRATKQAFDAIASWDERTKLLNEIHLEFKPNGGQSFRDVLDRVERYSASSRGRVSALIDYHAVAAFETDAEGGIVWVSSSWCDLYGMLPENAAGNGWMSGVHEDDRQHLEHEWKSAVAGHRQLSSTFRVGNHDVGYTKVRIKGVILRSARNVITGYAGTLAIVEPVAMTSPVVVG